MKIKINGWDKYNPKRAQKSYSWLRLDNEIYNDQKLFSLTPTQKWCWICLLCLASKRNDAEVDLGPDASNYFAHITGINLKEFKQFIEIIQKNQLATLSCSVVLQTDQSTTLTDGRTDETDETDETVATLSSTTALGPKDIIAVYCQFYKERYKHNPAVTQKEAGIAKQLVKDLNSKNYRGLIEAYFQMPDSWLVKKSHPLALLKSNFAEVWRFYKSGKFVSRSDLKTVDKQTARKSQYERLMNEYKGS